MRVLLMPASYPPELGGVQTVSAALATYLHDGGHAVRVLTNRYPRTLPSSEVLDKVPVDRLPFLAPARRQLRAHRPDLFLAALYCYPAAARRLHRIVREFEPDVINVHFPVAMNSFVLRLRRHHPTRLVVSLHGDDVLGFGRRTPAEQRAFVAILRAADHLTACSAFLLDQARSIEPSIDAKSEVIHNGVDLMRFASPSGPVRRRRYVLSYGRQTFDKGCDLLIDAFTVVAPRFPDVDLLLAGDGVERSRLEQQAIDRGLTGRVTFYGRASPAQVVELLDDCELAVFPRRSEPFGIVALEAMAAGKAVLATSVGGLPEILPHPPNRLVEPTSEALAGALTDWLARPEDLRAAGIANRHNAAGYTWERALTSFERALAVR